MMITVCGIQNDCLTSISSPLWLRSQSVGALRTSLDRGLVVTFQSPNGFINRPYDSRILLVRQVKLLQKNVLLPDN